MGRSDAFHEEISPKEARGNSEPVSSSQFQSMASRGAAKVNRFAATPSGAKGLDRNWESIKDSAHAEVQKSWGGSTFNARSGRPARPSRTDKFSVSTKEPGQSSVSMPENVSREQFGAHMDEARQRFSSQLNMRRGHLGVFHDDEEHRIDIDPSVVVRRQKSSDQIGAHTRAIGGAYNFKNGNGYFPPHVAN